LRNDRFLRILWEGSRGIDSGLDGGDGVWTSSSSLAMNSWYATRMSSGVGRLASSACMPNRPYLSRRAFCRSRSSCSFRSKQASNSNPKPHGMLSSSALGGVDSAFCDEYVRYAMRSSVASQEECEDMITLCCRLLVEKENEAIHSLFELSRLRS
jgi:hypothetical protein